MARKSRKHIENSTAPVRSPILRAAVYLRISEAKPGLPSESIENQRKVIEEFLNRRPDLTRSQLMKMSMSVAVAFG